VAALSIASISFGWSTLFARSMRVGEAGRGAEKTPRARSTEATLADLQVLWGGRDRLLRVAEVAELLAVGAWAVYKLCEDEELPHVRINNSIRVRPTDLVEFIAARTRTGQRTKHRPQK
jgi:excisionase family DNA binding protein